MRNRGEKSAAVEVGATVLRGNETFQVCQTWKV
jgi:hypothetical protein